MGGGTMAELSGVPKPLLQTVFGRHLGRRIWQQNRRRDMTATANVDTAKAASSHRTPQALWQWIKRFSGSLAAAAAGPVTDAEILAGMIEYVGLRAGETLGAQGHQATAIGLRITYVDGISRTERMGLARPTNDGRELSMAAISLVGRCEERGVCVASVNLTLTSVATERVAECAANLQAVMAGATCA
jgi:hypothetical protein